VVVDEEEPSLAAAGHRERLRARALATRCEGMPDYELLELFLFRSIPQKDVNRSPRRCSTASARSPAC
jgi:DNA repair protein RadC